MVPGLEEEIMIDLRLVRQLPSLTCTRDPKLIHTYKRRQHVDPRPQHAVAGPEHRQEGRNVDRRRVELPAMFLIVL